MDAVRAAVAAPALTAPDASLAHASRALPEEDVLAWQALRLAVLEAATTAPVPATIATLLGRVRQACRVRQVVPPVLLLEAE